MKKSLLGLAVASMLLFPATSFAAAKKAAPKKTSSSAASCVIKGNISTDKKKEKIFHVPGCASYKATVIDTAAGERWFCTEKEAKDAGWRKAKNC
jgi:micrococcal nuclease